MNNKKQYELPFGELIDKFTITQLRETLLNSDKYAEELLQLEHDIDMVAHEKNIVLNARMIRLIFIMGQLNTLIWVFKDKMAEDTSEENYVKYLKLSHQVNGLKNTVKNKLMQCLGDSSAAIKTNTWIDTLKYRISI